MEQKTSGYEPIQADKVPWEKLETVLGVKKEYMSEENLNALLNYKKTDLMQISAKVDGVFIRTDARLSLRKNGDNEISFNVHAIRNKPELNFPYMGYRFSDEDKKVLMEKGNLGKVVDLDIKGEQKKAFISIDPQTNEVVHLFTDKVNIANTILGAEISDKQKEGLRNGEAVLITGMTDKQGNKFDAKLQVNAEKRGLEFLFESNNLKNGKQVTFSGTSGQGSFVEAQDYLKKEGIEFKIDGFKISAQQGDTKISGNLSNSSYTLMFNDLKPKQSMKI